MSGWIKIHRRIKENWLYPKKRIFTKLEAWIDLLIMVNHKSQKKVINNEVIEIKRGERDLSYRYLAKKWKWSHTKIKRYFTLLQKDNMIRLKKRTGQNLVSVCNYERYQDSHFEKRTRSEQGAHKVRTRSERIKEREEGKERKEEEDLRLDIKAIWDKTKNRFGLVDDQYHYYRHCLVEMEQRWGDRTNEIVDRFLKDKESEIRDLRYLCERGIDKYAGVQPEELEKEKELTFVCPEGHKDRRVSKSKNLYAVCRKCYNRLVPIDKVALEKSIGGLA